MTGAMMRELRPMAGWLRRIWPRSGGQAERAARAAACMPARHPERLTGELPGGQEEWLAGLAAALWPDDEYAAIIAETRREDRP